MCNIKQTKKQLCLAREKKITFKIKTHKSTIQIKYCIKSDNLKLIIASYLYKTQLKRFWLS